MVATAVESNVVRDEENEEFQECSLLARTRELLTTTQETYLTIYARTGLHPNWLSGIASRRIRDPSVNRIQALYEYLTAQELIKD